MKEKEKRYDYLFCSIAFFILSASNGISYSSDEAIFFSLMTGLKLVASVGFGAVADAFGSKIPLLFSCVSIGEELSAAAVTRGLGAPVKRTSPYELRLKAADWVTIGIFAVFVGLFIAVKYLR